MRFALVGIWVLVPALARADSFDDYTNTILAKVPQATGVQKLTKVTPAQMLENARVLPGVNGCLLVVKTNDNRWSRMLVQPARQKVGDESVPILLIDRFVTFREGEEKTILVQGQSVRLFEGFRFSFDVGQVVPEKLAGDLRLAVDGDGAIEPLGNSQIYLVTKHLSEAAPKKSDKIAAGAAFDPTFVNGVYKLYDDGRRSGTLHLKLSGTTDMEGFYYSDKDGRKYEVRGRLEDPKYKLQFTITFPQSVQTFQGWLFTDGAQAITGFSRLQEREAGFYALRQEADK